MKKYIVRTNLAEYEYEVSHNGLERAIMCAHDKRRNVYAVKIDGTEELVWSWAEHTL